MHFMIFIHFSYGVGFRSFFERGIIIKTKSFKIMSKKFGNIPSYRLYGIAYTVISYHWYA